MGVCSKSVRLMETCARLRAFSSTPIDFTYRSPPEEKRIALAILFAIPTSAVFKFTLYAIKNLRAPTTVTPAVGCNFGSPTSGCRSRFFFISSRSPSNCPRRTFSRFTRSGRVAAAS